MLESRLELRSPLWIALAYLVAPVCGLTAWMAIGLAFDHGADRTLGPFLVVLAVGVPSCLLVEAVAVTPILVGFHRLRWWWLNGWSAAAIGFVLAVAVWAVLFHVLPSEPPDPPDAWRVTRDWTLPGWAYLAAMQVVLAAWWGVIGLVAALVFRWIAVRPRATEARSTP